MSTVLMALGPFRFSIDSAILQRIERRYPFRHVDQDLVGRAPGSQFLGPGVEHIQLPCLVYPVFLPGAGLSQIEAMRKAGESGQPLMLAAGTGRVLGNYTIRSVDDSRDHLLPGGIAQKVDAMIEIARYVPVSGGAGGGLPFSLFG
ncbi:hypothetical protein AFEL58S_02013 [Afipia felis]